MIRFIDTFVFNLKIIDKINIKRFQFYCLNIANSIFINELQKSLVYNSVINDETIPLDAHIHETILLNIFFSYTPPHLITLEKNGKTYYSSTIFERLPIYAKNHIFTNLKTPKNIDFIYEKKNIFFYIEPIIETKKFLDLKFLIDLYKVASLMGNLVEEAIQLRNENKKKENTND